MNPLCTDFRARLARALVEHTSREAEGFEGAVAWHEHVLTCGACRELLESEEALEDLLASLPLPSLPPELARRVLQRLQPTRAELELDRLLDDALSANDAFAAPPRLASDMLSRLSGARELARLNDKLDALLERVPAPSTPPGLPQRVLQALAPHRERVERVARNVAARSAAPAPRPAPRPFVSRPLLAAAAVLALVGGAAWLWSRTARPVDSPSEVEGPFVRRSGTSSDAVARVDPPNAPKVATRPEDSHDAPERRGDPIEPLGLTEPDAELLAQLELLESWDLLTDESLDFELVGIDEDTLLGLTTSIGALEGDASNGSESPDSTPQGSTPQDSGLQDSGPRNAPRAGETRNG